MNSEPIFKIISRPDLAEMIASGIYHGSPADARDGFLHFSTEKQIPGTLQKHYQGVSDLWLVAVDPDTIGNLLRWEISRDGDRFPHLYGPLPLAAVQKIEPVHSDC